MELSSLAAVRAHVERGMGIALLSRASVTRELAERRLVEIADPRTPIRRTLHLVHLGVRAEGGDTAFLDKAGSEEEEILFALVKRCLKEKPNGWKDGSTWSTVPGLQDGGNNEVVIATRGHGTAEGVHVPKKGDGHNSYNLVAHETMHAVDRLEGEASQTNDFLQARDDDMDAIQKDEYLNQPDEWGPRESYAEVAARYYGGDPTLEAEMPSLYAYFASREDR